MGFFRFRRRIKLIPHVWFNLSKTGISTSVGDKGFTVNFRRGQVKTTASIPGTGLSYIQTTRTHADPPRQATTGEHEEQEHRAIAENPPPSTSKIAGIIFLLLLVLLIFLLVK
ncbi:MAG: DUF4236 domain-containing protein [Gallionellaceae bacterium]